ncbi:hypothetical protein K3495_g5456 [Podosphaera aphanis]|nr:hypothetical protein K3495_g5456 [Podosphaera aphanis]
MFTPSVIIIALVALTQLAVASIPACFIDVLGAQSNPADLKAICGKNQQDVTAKIYDMCKNSDDKAAAMSAFASTCLEQVSMTISTDTTICTTTTSYDASKSTETSTKSYGGDSSYTSTKGYSTATSTKSYSTATSTASYPKTTSGSSHNRPLTAAVLVLAGVISRFLL